VRSLDAGVMPAGEATVRFAGGDLAALPAGDYSVRVTAESGYEGSAGATAQGRFAWNGSSLAALDRATLLGGQPNPFRASTTVGFALPHAAPAHSLAVYDISGRLVRDLSSGPVSGGSHAVTWNGRDDAGRDVAAGIYFVQLSVGKFVDTRKVVHLR